MSNAGIQLMNKVFGQGIRFWSGCFFCVPGIVYLLILQAFKDSCTIALLDII